MPRFDGTGPQGQGPISGRGEGYCAIKLPRPGQAADGYAGLQGAPVRGSRFSRWLRTAAERGAGRGRGRRGRGRR